MTEKSLNPDRITKQELARLLGYTSQGLAKLLNKGDWFEKLKATGYNRFQKSLFRHQLDAIFPKGIDFEKI